MRHLSDITYEELTHFVQRIINNLLLFLKSDITYEELTRVRY